MNEQQRARLEAIGAACQYVSGSTPTKREPMVESDLPFVVSLAEYIIGRDDENSPHGPDEWRLRAVRAEAALFHTRTERDAARDALSAEKRRMPDSPSGYVGDEVDEALALDLYGAWMSILPEDRSIEWPSGEVREIWMDVARAAREHIAEWRAEEVERLLEENRDLKARAERTETSAEPAPADTDEDADYALASAMWNSRNAVSFSATHSFVRSDYVRMARVAREHIEDATRRAVKAEALQIGWKTAAEEWRKRAEEVEAERDSLRDERDSLRHVLGHERDTSAAREEWLRGRHASLRNDVAACRNACQIEDILYRDELWGEQP